jgi:hypothetical protein
VALDWRNFGREAAVARLQYELDHRGVGVQVGDEQCQLEQVDAGRRVSCEWSVNMQVPGRDAPVPLTFSSVAVVGPDGSLQ